MIVELTHSQKDKSSQKNLKNSFLNIDESIDDSIKDIQISPTCSPIPPMPLLKNHAQTLNNNKDVEEGIMRSSKFERENREMFKSKKGQIQSLADPIIQIQIQKNDDNDPNNNINGKKIKKAFLNELNQLKVKTEIIKPYNQYLIPPDWNAARRHAVKYLNQKLQQFILISNKKAKRVGRNKVPTSHNNEEEYEICPCCDYQVVRQNQENSYEIICHCQEKEELNIREQANKLSFLGSGYPLFFHYMKYCIMILGLIILTSGEYNLLSNFYGGSCITQAEKQENEKHNKPNQTMQCISDWISVWSIANKHKKLDYAEIQDILNFSTVIVLIILLFFFRKEQKEIDSLCDMAELTPADYTLMMKGLPKWTTKKDIKEFFEGGSEDFGGKLKTTEINLVYDLSEKEKKLERKKQKVDSKQQELSRIEYSSPEFAQPPFYLKRIDVIINKSKVAKKWDKSIQKENLKLELLNFEIESDSNCFNGYAFVSFQTEDQKQLVLQSSTQSLCKEILLGIFFQSNEFKTLKYGILDIEVSEAPEPLDIIWENLNSNESLKKIRRALSFVVTMVLFGVCICLVYLLIKFQTDSIKQFEKEHQTDLANPSKEFQDKIKLLFEEQLPTAIVSFCMVCINSVIIELILRQIVKMESHNTFTLYNINLAQKLSLALFINTALITCFFNFFYTKNVFGKGGLIYTIFYFFVVNAATSFLTIIFDPMYQFNKIQAYFCERRGNKCNLTQEQANLMCQYPLHEIEIGYVDIMKTMYITIFYSPVVPFGIVISLIGFCLYYWAQKYTVIKGRMVDKQISVKLSLEMTEYLEFIISIYTASNLLFKYQTVGEISYLQIFGFVIGFIYSFLPIQVLIEKIFFFGNVNEQVSYEDAYPLFVTTYSLCNPITKENAKKKYYEKTQLSFSERNNKSCSDVNSLDHKLFSKN